MRKAQRFDETNPRLWECHIQGDWLLIWSQDDTELILLFTDTGTHSDLF